VLIIFVISELAQKYIKKKGGHVMLYMHLVLAGGG
jgi:hypothetical protein